jgi:thiaminase/transcriptional activator TenA
VGQSEHPLYGQWTAFYVAGYLQVSVEAWRGFVDAAARQASPQEMEAMREAFFTSSRYEYLFWEMAYRQEQWPI